MIRACVIGWPISHSRSPLIHGFWLKQHGIDGSYERIPVASENLATFIRGIGPGGFSGCNVTIPHKEAVFGLVTPADETTRRLGAVNTVYVREGRVCGTNTDGEGFINSLRAGAPALRLQGTRAVVLGAGGSALSVVNALLENGAAEVAVVNRSRERAEALQQRFGKRVAPLDWNARSDSLADCSILVNTTSLGMKGQPPLDIGLDRLPATAVVTDIVYIPMRTDFLRNAATRGNPVVEGLGMLLHQAVRGFELWFGVRPAVTPELHRLVARDIDPDHQS